MDPSSRITREQRSGMRDDDTGTGGQWDNPMSKGSQGKWEQREGEAFTRRLHTSRSGGRPPLRALSSPQAQWSALTWALANYSFSRQHWWPGGRYVHPTASWPERLRVRNQHRRRRADWYRPGWHRDFGPVRRPGEGHDH